MNLVRGFLLLPIIAICLIPFLKMKGKAIAVYATVSFIAFLTSFIAIRALVGESFDLILAGSFISGPIRLHIDSLSAWFILIFNFSFFTGGFYGLFYMNAYKEQTKNLTLQGIMFLLLYTSLLSLCAIQNSFIFIIAWEIMALSAFFSVIFEHERTATIKAGINFLIQSHVSIICLIIGFLWVASQTGSYDFIVIRNFATANPGTTSMELFLVFFVGFAIKAGFVPFHTWLPYAHPAAPSHISGIMSGVIIKIGIFGILRMLLLIKVDYLTIGIIILIISIISGVYGIMLAILQKNLKKILAYSSVENIGIIGIGIGLGCIGLGTKNPLLSSLGFAGALLHTLNHSLFKSLLFFTAGNVYQATHTLDIEKLGGLLKKMPHTAFLFLIAALAISGLPPFNGFISEFILYTGLFSMFQSASVVSLLGIVCLITGLALIGGLAIICFTKVYGVVFLGNPRHDFKHEVKEMSRYQLLPLYIITLFIVFIGLFPGVFLDLLIKPVQLFTEIQQLPFTSFQGNSIETLVSISKSSIYLISTVLIIWIIRKLVLRKKAIEINSTWGCGYTAPTSKIQYTGNSFTKTYNKLFAVIFQTIKTEKEVYGVFPSDAHIETKAYDKIEKWLIDYPLIRIRIFFGKFLFIQNGRIQSYVAYGILFITIITILTIFNFLK